jgi:urease accessory protein UreE
MRLITEAPAPVGAAALAGRARDTLRLTWEERRWTRKRAVTTAGREIALALPTGTVLEPGDVLAVEADWYLVVEARPEPVLVLFPESYEGGAAFDWQPALSGRRRQSVPITATDRLGVRGAARDGLLAAAS